MHLRNDGEFVQGKMSWWTIYHIFSFSSLQLNVPDSDIIADHQRDIQEAKAYQRKLTVVSLSDKTDNNKDKDDKDKEKETVSLHLYSTH